MNYIFTPSKNPNQQKQQIQEKEKHTYSNKKIINETIKIHLKEPQLDEQKKLCYTIMTKLCS